MDETLKIQKLDPIDNLVIFIAKAVDYYHPNVMRKQWPIARINVMGTGHEHLAYSQVGKD